jgi:hypothetical protein
MPLNATTIAAGFAALTITGVTVKAIGAMPEQVTARDCPLLMPAPNFVLGGITSSEDSEGPATFGASGAGMWVFQRVWQWRYCHAAVGSARGMLDHYAGMMTAQDAIITALCALDIANVDVMEIDCNEFGVVTDPAGNQFFGFDIAVALKERINA